MRRRDYRVYVLSSLSGVIYAILTDNRRVQERKRKTVAAFTARYNANRHVYAQNDTDANAAIAREKQVKRRSRVRTAALTEAANWDWKDLSAGWE